MNPSGPRHSRLPSTSLQLCDPSPCNPKRAKVDNASRSSRGVKLTLARRFALRWRPKEASVSQQHAHGDQDLMSSCTTSTGDNNTTNSEQNGRRLRRWRPPQLRRQISANSSPTHSSNRQFLQNTSAMSTSQKLPRDAPTETMNSNDKGRPSRLLWLMPRTTAQQQHLKGLNVIAEAPIPEPEIYSYSEATSISERTCHGEISAICPRTEKESDSEKEQVKKCNDHAIRRAASSGRHDHQIGRGQKSQVDVTQATKSKSEFGWEADPLAPVLDRREGQRERRRRGASSLGKLSLGRITRELRDGDEAFGMKDNGAANGITRLISRKSSSLLPSKYERPSGDSRTFGVMLERFRGTKDDGLTREYDKGLESPWGLKVDDGRESREKSVVSKMMNAMWKVRKESGTDSEDFESDSSREDRNSEGGNGDRMFSENGVCRGEVSDGKLASWKVELTQDDFIDFCSPSTRSRSLFGKWGKLMSPRKADWD